MATFGDTSGFYALLDARDPAHEQARAVWASFASRKEVVATSNYVVLETVALLQNRAGMGVAARFVTEVVPVLQVLWLDAALHSRAVEAWLTAGRRLLSLVDCTSFVLMHEHGIGAAFAFDSHFAERGYDLVPPRVAGG